MLIQIETLIALKKHKTMLQTSTALRVSQSTISKRISSLEETYKTKLLKKQGRNVYLTKNAETLISKTSPLLAQIKDALKPQGKGLHQQEKLKIKLGFSESILSSWGPSAVLPVFDDLKIDYELHCHRSPTVQDKVSSGEYDLGICVGKTRKDSSLIFDLMTKEEMVLVSTRKDQKGYASIEETASSWKDIRSKVNLDIDLRLESFFSVGQIAKSGNLKGLIPIGVSRELGFKKNQVRSLKPKVSRNIWLIYRKSQLSHVVFSRLIKELLKVNI